MWPRFGIKIGNTTLCIAYIKADGKAEVIANKQGDRVSQACLLWDGNNEIECGLTAKQKMAAKPKQAVGNSLQFLLPHHVLQDDVLATALKRISCEYDAFGNSFTLRYKHPETEKEVIKSISAFDCHVHLFKAELELARQYHNNSTEKPIVVLSVPSYYPVETWYMLAEAAETAGFHVAQIIKEPTAAILAYGLGESDQTEVDHAHGICDSDVVNKRYVLTVKSGAIWSHFSLYCIQDGFYTELETHQPFAIGGACYDEAFVNFICAEFYRKYKLDPKESRRSMTKIRAVASNCKHILTTLPSTQVYIDSLMDGIDFNMQMSRARLESLIQPVINQFLKVLSEFVETALKNHSEIECIDTIVLLGATTQIPKLQAAISALYPEAQVQSNIPADEVAAIGCARQSMYLNNPDEKWSAQSEEELICSDEKVVIWHADDEQNAKTLLETGSFLPKTIQLEIKPSEHNNGNVYTNKFHIKAGEEIHEVVLDDASITESGVFHLEAKIGRQSNEDSVRPVINLRSL